jgi:hypothetical protein
MLESIDLLMDLKKMGNLGFAPNYSILDEDRDNRFDNKFIKMSPNGLYSFSVKQVLTQSEGSLRRDAEVIE